MDSSHDYHDQDDAIAYDRYMYACAEADAAADAEAAAADIADADNLIYEHTPSWPQQLVLRPKPIRAMYAPPISAPKPLDQSIYKTYENHLKAIETTTLASAAAAEAAKKAIAELEECDTQKRWVSGKPAQAKRLRAQLVIADAARAAAEAAAADAMEKSQLTISLVESQKSFEAFYSKYVTWREHVRETNVL